MVRIEIINLQLDRGKTKGTRLNSSQARTRLESSSTSVTWDRFFMQQFERNLAKVTPLPGRSPSPDLRVKYSVVLGAEITLQGQPW